MNHDYVSCFAEYIKGMLDARDALGYAREPHAATLLSFDKYCSMQHPDCVELTEHLVMLPRLRAYMGHYTLKETAYYVHLLPENLSKNRGIDWEAFSEIIPEVEPWQE